MEPHGLRKVGIATFVVGLVLGIIVPFAQFGGVFTPPWIVGVVILPLFWGAVWTFRARRRNWLLVLLAQWASLFVACWVFFGSATSWSVPAFVGGVVFGSLILIIWMLPVAIIAALPGRP